ncbi:MAG: RuBisCO large subunit C-terminal-like domain-containing protein [Parvibaculaceae bacterium]
MIEAVYHVRGDAGSIEERARTIAVEQSVEMPVSAIADERVRNEIVGRVLGIGDLGGGAFEVRIGLSAETVGADPGQLLNMLFGNTSLHEDVVLQDAVLPEGLMAAFGGPNAGLEGLWTRVGAGRRALTCSALKPQGLSPAGLADLARRFADGGIDYIKDDHGLADQAYSPFAARVEAVAAAIRGMPTRYLPSLTGNLDAMRGQVEAARGAGLDTVMVAPMVSGVSNLHRLARDNPDLAFMAHPSLGGAARISPELLFGKLFRLFGADAIVFPNHGGRFGYSPETCRALAAAALGELGTARSAVPVPAGGMTTDRVGEMLDFYGADIMLLIGGGLLAAGDRLPQETAAFVAAVRKHGYAT